MANTRNQISSRCPDISAFNAGWRWSRVIIVLKYERLWATSWWDCCSNPQVSTVARNNSLLTGRNLQQDPAFKEELSCWDVCVGSHPGDSYLRLDSLCTTGILFKNVSFVSLTKALLLDVALWTEDETSTKNLSICRSVCLSFSSAERGCTNQIWATSMLSGTSYPTC